MNLQRLADRRYALQQIGQCSLHRIETRKSAYRALFRSELEEEALGDIREALQLGMPLGSDRFAEAICARLGVRRNSGKRGRIVGQPMSMSDMTTEQRTLGF